MTGTLGNMTFGRMMDNGFKILPGKYNIGLLDGKYNLSCTALKHHREATKEDGTYV